MQGHHTLAVHGNKSEGETPSRQLSHVGADRRGAHRAAGHDQKLAAGAVTGNQSSALLTHEFDKMLFLRC